MSAHIRPNGLQSLKQNDVTRTNNLLPLHTAHKHMVLANKTVVRWGAMLRQGDAGTKGGRGARARGGHDVRV